MIIEPTIAEINVVLAAFEGRQFYGHSIDKFGGDTGNALPEMKYHTSWDWLMPVWIKFRNLMHDEKLFNKNNNWITSLEWYLLSSDQPKRFFERIYYAIIWYNQQSKTNDTGTEG